MTKLNVITCVRGWQTYRTPITHLIISVGSTDTTTTNIYSKSRNLYLKIKNFTYKQFIKQLACVLKAENYNHVSY